MMGNLGALYTTLGRYGEAETLLAAAVEAVQHSLPREHIITGTTFRKYGQCLTGLERYAEAEAALIEAREILTAALGAEHSRTRTVVSSLVILYDVWGKPDKAAEWRAKVVPDED